MKNKILCIHQGFELYGSDRSFIRSIKAIREGFPDLEITVVLPKKGILVDHLCDLVDHLEINDLGVIRKSDFKEKGITYLFHLLVKGITAAKFIQEYDYLYINSIVTIGCIFPTLFSKKRRSVIHVREIPTGLLSFAFSILLRLSYSDLIFNSHATKNSFCFVNKQQSHVIYNGVRGIDSNKVPLIHSQKINILLLGRLNSWKGQTFLLYALGQLETKYLNRISVRIVGDYFENQKRYLDEIVRLRKNFNLESVVSLHPFAEDPSLHYDWAHVVVVPSTKPEPFGLVAIEAMSVGKPVIGSNHGGLSEIIIDNKTGSLFEPGNQKEFNRAIISFINNPNKIIEFGTAGKKRFKKKFHENIYIKSMKDLLIKIIKND